MKFLHECEVCGKKEVLSNEEAFNQGWDYPPRIGLWGVVSPRTCGSCDIEKTAWWALQSDGNSFETLPQHHRRTIRRIRDEPTNPLSGAMFS